MGGVHTLHALALFSLALAGCAASSGTPPSWSGAGAPSAEETARLSVRFIDGAAGAPFPCRWILHGAEAASGEPDPRFDGIGASLEFRVGAGEWFLEIDPLDAGAVPRRIAFELEAGEERYEEIEIDREDGAAGP